MWIDEEEGSAPISFCSFCLFQDSQGGLPGSALISFCSFCCFPDSQDRLPGSAPISFCSFCFFKIPRADCLVARLFRFAVLLFSIFPGLIARQRAYFVLQFLFFQDSQGGLPGSAPISFCSFCFFSSFPGPAAWQRAHFVLQFYVFFDRTHPFVNGWSTRAPTPCGSSLDAACAHFVRSGCQCNTWICWESEISG
ncbi:MAG TPA: hypothetical protein VHR86_03205, partial [Armatimonadota bacterium]|nr:hypothetical protein [Armatimonadota bacterium]